MKSIFAPIAIVLLAVAGCAEQSGSGDGGSQTSTSAGGEIAPPASLTANERKTIWPILSDDAKLAAIEFIKNGGTLTQFADS